MADKDNLSSFHPFIMIMFYNGIDFTPNSQYRRYLCLLFRLKSLLSYTYLIIVSLMYTLNTKLLYGDSMFKYHKNLNLYGISYHIRFWIAMITFINIIYNCDQIKSIMFEVESRMTTKTKRRMVLLNTVLMVAVLFTSTATSLILTILAVIGGQNLHKIIRTIIVCQCLIWQSSSLCFLIIICYGIYLIEKTAFGNLSVNNFDGQPNYEEYHRTLLDIQSMKENVNLHLGCLPFLWFGQAFSSTVLRLTHVSTTRFEDGVNFFRVFFEFILMVFYDLFYLLAINYFQNQRPTANQLMKSFCSISSDTNKNVKLMIVQNSITSYLNTEYKAWNTFTLDKSFLFTLFGTIVTFTVMFVQLFEIK